MNPATFADGVTLAALIKEAVELPIGVDVVVCPPTIWLDALQREMQGSGIALGAQTMHWERSGPHTGETSPAMLASDPFNPLVTHVIVGHSERRADDGETDEKVSRKVAAAIEHGIVPIAAIGETLAQRQGGEAEAVVHRQLEAAVSHVAGSESARMAIAYEPVWAIGTGAAASAADAQAMIHQIRGWLVDALGDDAGALPILYGGSVTRQNASELFAEPDIDGALVGTASLNPGEFAAIVRAAAARMA
jgi:triosephosphate isomerase